MNKASLHKTFWLVAGLLVANAHRAQANDFYLDVEDIWHNSSWPDATITVGDTVHWTSNDPDMTDYPIAIYVDGASLSLGYYANDVSHTLSSSGSFFWEAYQAIAGNWYVSGYITVNLPTTPPSLTSVKAYPSGNSPTGSNASQSLELDGSSFDLFSPDVHLKDGRGYSYVVSSIDTMVIGSGVIRVNFALGNDADNWTAWVTNPDLQSSSTKPLHVVAPVPTINSLSPGSVIAGTVGFTLTVNGATFGRNSVVYWNGSPLTTYYVSPDGGQTTTALNALVPDIKLASAGSAYVTVKNPAPGGGTSVSQIFIITQPPPKLLGIDVHSKRSGISWSQVISSGGKNFALFKVSQGPLIGQTPGCGVSLSDKPLIDTHILGAKNAGLSVGAYHFAEIRHPHDGTQFFCADLNATLADNAKEEANWFLTIASPYIGTGFFPPILDIDVTALDYGLSGPPNATGGHELSTWIRNWFATVQAAAQGITPVLYLGKDTLSTLDSDIQNGSFCPLWIADLAGSSQTLNPTYNGQTWANWTLKQYSWTGTVPGISGAVDLDSFNGDINALNALSTVTPTLPTPLYYDYFYLGKIGLWCLNPGAEIYYTTDGSAPLQNTATLYTGQIPKSTGFLLRAVAYENGYNPSAEFTRQVPGGDLNNISPEAEQSQWQDFIARPDHIAGDPNIRSMELTLIGQPGADWVIQGSHDLKSWFSISTNTMATNASFPMSIGAVTVIDGSITNEARRFYRAVFVPTIRSYTITLQPGLSLIASQLNHGNNSLSEIFTNEAGALNGDRIRKLNDHGGYDVWVFDSTKLTGFADLMGMAIPSTTLEPGEGAFYDNALNVSRSITFSGTTPVPALPVSLPQGCGNVNLLGCQTNGAGTYENIVGLAPREGSQLQRWTGSSFSVYTFSGGAWTPGMPPLLNVGESAAIVVPCITPAGISRQPASRTESRNGTATFTVVPTGPGPFSYQWQFNGTNLSGATESSYTVSGVQPLNVGDYTVVVSNPFGSLTSAIATLRLDNTPLVLNCAPDTTVECGRAWDFGPPFTFGGCCGTNLTLTILDTATNGSGCSQSFTRTWRAADCCGNIATCSQTVTVVGTVDLDVSAAAFPNPVVAGSNTTVTVTVRNNGTGLASAVSLRNVIPASLRFLSATSSQGACNFTNAPLGVNAFAPVIQLPANAGPSTNTRPASLISVDLDGDGYLDLVSADSWANGGPSGYISIFRNGGAVGALSFNSFPLRREIPVPAAYDVVAGDFDGDGRPDLALTAPGRVVRVVLLRNISTGPGDIRFESPVVLAGPGGGYALATGDLNNDGKPDLVVANENLSSISIFENRTTGPGLGTNSFGPAINITVGAQPRCLAVGDLDGSGWSSLVVGFRETAAVAFISNLHTALLTSNSFAPAALEATPTAISSILIDNFYGDGISDVILSRNSHIALTSADLNGDGQLDIAEMDQNTGLVTIFQNTSSDGNLSLIPLPGTVRLAANSPTALHLLFKDLNNDGQPDLVATVTEADTLAIAPNTSLRESTCDLGTLAPGATATVTLVLGAPNVGPSYLPSVVASLEFDLNPLNDQVPTLISVVPNQPPPAFRAQAQQAAVAPVRLFRVLSD